MSASISRYFLGGRDESTANQIGVDTVLADAEAVNFENSAGGEIYVPSGSSLTSLTFHVARHSSDTFFAAYTEANAAVTLTVAAGRAYPIPSAIFGAGSFKMVGNADGYVYVTRKG